MSPDSGVAGLYHHIRGRVIQVSGQSAVIEAAGVGYELSCTAGCASRLRPGQDALVLTHHHLNQDGFMKLFGFADPGERAMFLALRTVRGVGPAVAMSVLSALGVPELVSAIRNEDRRAFLQVKGVGKKTAEHILLDLRDKLPAEAAAEAARAPAPAAGIPAADAVAALVSLGYPQASASRAVDEARRTIPEDAEIGLQQLVRLSLAKVGQG